MKYGFVIRPAPATFQATEFIDEWIKYGKCKLDYDHMVKYKYYYPELTKKIRIIEKILSINSCKNIETKRNKIYKSEKEEFPDFLINIIVDYNVSDNKIREIIEYALDLDDINDNDVIPLI